MVLDRAATPFLAFRLQQSRTLLEELFALIMLGDDRVIRATHVAGACAHVRTE